MSFIEQTLIDIATDKNIEFVQRKYAAVTLAQLTKGKILIDPKSGTHKKPSKFLQRAIREFKRNNVYVVKREK